MAYPLNRAERDVLRGEMRHAVMGTDRSLAQQYSHLLTTEEAGAAELTVGTHRLPMGEVGFADDLSECGGLLQFYMPVTLTRTQSLAPTWRPRKTTTGSTCTPPMT